MLHIGKSEANAALSPESSCLNINKEIHFSKKHVLLTRQPIMSTFIWATHHRWHFWDDFVDDLTRLPFYSFFSNNGLYFVPVQPFFTRRSKVTFRQRNSVTDVFVWASLMRGQDAALIDVSFQWNLSCSPAVVTAGTHTLSKLHWNRQVEEINADFPPSSCALLFCHHQRTAAIITSFVTSGNMHEICERGT